MKRYVTSGRYGRIAYREKLSWDAQRNWIIQTFGAFCCRDELQSLSERYRQFIT